MKIQLIPALVAAFLMSSIAALRANAQRAPLPLGSVKQVVSSTCPSGFLAGMNCFSAQISCPDTADIGFTYGVEGPDVAEKGTIVFLEGGSGTSDTSSVEYSGKYLDAGFRIVQFVWDSPWGVTGNTTSTGIKVAACRPATFLNYVYQNLYSAGGMCAQGDSAGSGAAAYSLAWYGGANFLDKVELLSGPVFGDIEEGCMVPHAPTVTVCPAGQLGCNGAPWPDPPYYVGADINGIDLWSGNSTCNSGSPTSKAADASWKSMSIVDGTDNPSFSYPQTAMAGWLCSNVALEQNNSAAEGEFFYQQFTDPGQTDGYSVTRIDHCSGTEGVSNGTTPQGVAGMTAISNDMINSCYKRHSFR
jgi:hypothetical protein